MISVTHFNFEQNLNGELKHLRNYALSLTMNLDDAKDLVQETILKAIRYKDKFVQGTNLRGWLFTILKNTFINNYRRNTKRNTIMDSTDNTYFLDQNTHGVENDGEMSFVRKDLETAINKLPNDLQTAFLLNAEGYQYQEIADDLDIPLGTVKTRIFMARKMLRSSLAAYGHLYGLEYSRGAN